MNFQRSEFTFKNNLGEIIVFIFNPNVARIPKDYCVTVTNKATNEVKVLDTYYQPSVESCRKIFNSLS